MTDQEITKRITVAERCAIIAQRSAADRLAAYEKLLRENARLRLKIEDLTMRKRIKVCSSDDRTETLREKSQYPLSSTDKAVRMVNNLSNLLREILMTIRTNRLRGTLTSADEQDFDRIIESWKAKWDEAVK